MSLRKDKDTPPGMLHDDSLKHQVFAHGTVKVGTFDITPEMQRAYAFEKGGLGEAAVRDMLVQANRTAGDQKNVNDALKKLKGGFATPDDSKQI